MQNRTGTADSNIKIINLILIPGLIGIALSLLFSNVGIMIAIVVIPLLLVLLIRIFREPSTLFFSVFVLNYFIIAASRYMNLSGLSFLMDILIAGTLVLILIHTALLRNFEWKYTLNVLTIGTFIWMLYCLAEIYNPSGMVKAWVLSRSLALYGFAVSLLASLLFNRYRMIRIFIFMLAIFTLLAVIKALIQKHFGFDETEVAWLNKGSYKTHLLSTGIRYFSFFTDAGNFGSNMGCAGVIFMICALYMKNKGLKIFYAAVSIAALYAMILSGTRGSLIVPLVGLALFSVVIKSRKTLITGGIILLAIYVFFAHTDIGQDNSYIRRMRTAFTPTEDASFNVRKNNQAILAEHLKNKPFGEGLGLSGVENQNISMRLTTTIPHDSWYVKIWVETGAVGLILYLGILLTAIGRGARIIMFKIKNRELKGILAGLLCGISGMLASAYGNAFWGQFPTAIIAFTGLALVLKGEYFEKELELKYLQENNKNT
ncbi:MAG: O-antigen ligase family protein [Tannerella sp.]|jgi:hypothetical protein|nr:O-antigen ligase family protein [Tannerella sp.]